MRHLSGFLAPSSVDVALTRACYHLPLIPSVSQTHFFFNMRLLTHPLASGSVDCIFCHLDKRNKRRCVFVSTHAAVFVSGWEQPGLTQLLLPVVNGSESAGRRAHICAQLLSDVRIRPCLFLCENSWGQILPTGSADAGTLQLLLKSNLITVAEEFSPSSLAHLQLSHILLYVSFLWVNIYLHNSLFLCSLPSVVLRESRAAQPPPSSCTNG